MMLLATAALTSSREEEEVVQFVGKVYLKWNLTSYKLKY